MDIDYHRMVQQLAFVYIYLSLYKIILKLGPVLQQFHFIVTANFLNEQLLAKDTVHRLLVSVNSLY
jgi:hypothetical protein